MIQNLQKRSIYWRHTLLGQSTFWVPNPRTGTPSWSAIADTQNKLSSDITATIFPSADIHLHIFSTFSATSVLMLRKDASYVIVSDSPLRSAMSRTAAVIAEMSRCALVEGRIRKPIRYNSFCSSFDGAITKANVSTVMASHVPWPCLPSKLHMSRHGKGHLGFGVRRTDRFLHRATAACPNKYHYLNRLIVSAKLASSTWNNQTKMAG